MDKDEIAKLIGHAVTKLPEWLRHDLSATEAAVRIRAEETLAAIIAAALDT